MSNAPERIRIHSSVLFQVDEDGEEFTAEYVTTEEDDGVGFDTEYVRADRSAPVGDKCTECGKDRDDVIHACATNYGPQHFFVAPVGDLVGREAAIDAVLTKRGQAGWMDGTLDAVAELLRSLPPAIPSVNVRAAADAVVEMINSHTIKGWRYGDDRRDEIEQIILKHLSTTPTERNEDADK